MIPNTTSDTGKHNAMKILKLIQQHDKLEEKIENSINIDKLRKNEFRENLKERKTKRGEKMRTLYEEINEKTIEINIRKREIYLEEDIGKMINRILEKKREKIDMSGLIIKENGKFTIEKNQEKIKQRVYNHFREWTSERKIDLDEIEYNQDWREIYSPREDIDGNIYHNLMSPIKREELDKVISGLKSNKAPGMSGITYDFWKKSKDLTRTIILEIFNESLVKANATDEWKKGVIYPINKTTRSHWNNDLKLARPIVLLETARKIWFKILTNRLSEILTKEQILTNTNYAALKNESTLEPLKIVQAVIEDANKYKKEAWILLMDISKAYDSVSSIMLKKCMERIKLPKNFIDLVMDVNLNRYNRVLVNNELTEEYYIEDGIDQGEVWSPLLWRIFYDALLTKLNEMKEEAGYNFYEEKLINKTTKETEILDISINATAFMDDTTLISKNKKELMKMIEVCHQFFRINDIKANITKYELIKINDKEKEDLIIEGEKIIKVNNEEGNRYLGIYFRYDNKRRIYKEKITSIVKSACNIFNWKRLNEKQIIAVWNIVIVPRIEYQLAAIVLTKNECNNLMTRLNGIIKKRAGLAKSTPNFILFEKDLLGLKHIYDLQMEMLYKNLLYQANGNEKLKRLFLIKISQEQKNIWTSKCPGEMQIESKCHHNWILAAMKALNEENIRICNHEIKNTNERHRIKGGRTDILEILNPKLIKNSVNSRRSKDVMFLEDLLEADGINMLKWKHLCKEKGRNTKGKIPKWFLNIEETIIEDVGKNTRKIKNEFLGQATKRNIHLNLLDTNEKIKKNNIITWNEIGDFPIFCEDKKKSKSKKYKRIGVHLEIAKDKLDWNNSPFLIKCEGCHRNIGKKNKEKKECLIYLENDISRIIERRKEDNFIKPYETLNNIIEKNHQLKKVIEAENKDEIYNERIDQIDNIIKSKEEFINIIKYSILEKNENEDNERLKYYIIIEVIKTKSIVDEKGIRRYGYKVIWKIIEERNGELYEKSEIMFIAKYEGINENEFKVILRSLILVLLILAEKSEIVLGINEHIQKLINEFRTNFSNRKKIDNEYYLELLYIDNFLEKHDIDLLELNAKNYKISKELRLKARESLKNEEIIKYNFEIVDDALITNEFNLYWNQRLINGGYRGWRKKVTNVIWKNEILNSNRLNDLFMYNHKKEFDWQTTLEFISNRIEFSKRQCGGIDTYERSYRIKNLLKDQPTYDTLFQRNTNKIEDNKCIRCEKKEVENWEHIWICEDNEFNLNEIIYESIHRFEEQLKESNQDENIEILRNYNIEFINILESPSIILRGKSKIWELIRSIYNNKFNDLTKKKEEKNLIKKLWRFTYKEIKNRIWIPRCDEVKRLEEKADIKKADLRKRKNDSINDLDSVSISDSDKGKIKKRKTTENIEKERKNRLTKKISLATRDKLTGKVIDGINIDNFWDTTVKIQDYIDI
ncbi:unnamed protein product [Rhizophagus irregularis]|nr:unnamed protein product [Rhizophagus irregularis]